MNASINGGKESYPDAKYEWIRAHFIRKQRERKHIRMHNMAGYGRIRKQRENIEKQKR